LRAYVRGGSALDETEAVAVGIADVHFPGAPSLVDGMPGVNLDTFGEEFGVKSVNIVDQKIRYAAGNAVSGERGEVQPHSVSRDTHVAGIWLVIVSAMGEFALEAQAVAIKFFRGGGIRNVDKRNCSLQQISPRLCQSRGL
jgi:hypothetical protein